MATKKAIRKATIETIIGSPFRHQGEDHARDDAERDRRTMLCHLRPSVSR